MAKELAGRALSMEGDILHFLTLQKAEVASVHAGFERQLLLRNCMTTPTFNWRRFWCPREANLVTSRGFLIDPEGEHGRHFNPDVVPFGAIQDTPCLALLGEPGIGKTTALDQHKAQLARQLAASGDHFVWKDLNAYQTDSLLVQRVFENPAVAEWARGSGRLHLFLDSFDECLIRVDVLAALIAEQLENFPLERLRLRIACRTAVWPSFLENRLRALWGDQALGVYELAPLRETDVAEAASARGLDSAAFLSEVSRREAQSLASTPVTLRFLLNTYEHTRTFPHTQVELYRQGCLHLCEEVSESRLAAGQRGELTGPQRLAVASRIAALSIFCARPTIFTGVDAGDLAQGEIGIRQIVGSAEAVDGLPFEITERAVREVLDTGLFSARGPQRLGFSHQTYAEFLAATYFSMHTMEFSQLLSLITCVSEGQTRVPPQLQETAAWLATIHRPVYDRIVDQDPQVLLGSDVTTMSPEARERLVESLLRAFNAGTLVDNRWEEKPKYRKLYHPRLAAQLQPYIEDASKTYIVRRVAIDITESCELRDLQTVLVNRVLDPAETLVVRQRAASAVSRIADGPTMAGLKPFIAGVPEDTQDELKGVALRALWPDQLTAAEVFAVITPPKDPNLFGAYRDFIAGSLLLHLSPGDLPIALRWLAPHAPLDSSSSPFRDLAESLLREAWDHLDEPGVLEPYAEAVVKRLCNYVEIPGLKTGLAGDHQAKRYRLVEAVVPLLLQAGTNPTTLVFAHTPLLRPEDFAWVLGQLALFPSEVLQAFWAKVATAVYRTDAPGHIDLLLEAYKSYPALHEEFADMLEPVDLDSPRAQRMRDYYRQSVEIERSQRRRPVLVRLRMSKLLCFSTSSRPAI